VTIYTIQKFCSMIGITLNEFFDFEWFGYNPLFTSLFMNPIAIVFDTFNNIVAN
jgi:hypothetical protein